MIELVERIPDEASAYELFEAMRWNVSRSALTATATRFPS